MSVNTRSKVSRGTLEKESLLQAKTEKVEMTLNTDNAIASGLLIQRLTELYEDPVEASVRETVSNALDAVMESHSGENPEVRIISPSSLNPVFTVRDNGVGMSYNDLKEIYSKYGASTKMDNFDQIGAYGLGAKAPLAYGTEFTVSSIKDGVRTTIIVVREELTNYIKIVDSSETDAPSGTSVSIPVSNYDIERFVEHIEKYRANPVDKAGVRMFINDEEIAESEFVEITDNMLIFRSGEDEVRGRLWIRKSSSAIVNIISNVTENDIKNSLQYLIGGWAYRNPANRGKYYGGRYGGNGPAIMVELKAGIVAFNSSRDAILENERYSALEELVVDYIKSDNFMTDLTKAVNEIDLDTFKTIVVNLLNRHIRDLHIKDSKILVNTSSSYYNITRKYSISDFVHKETGFKFDDIFTGVPKTPGKTAVIMEKKETYNKSVSNYVPAEATEEEDGSIRHFTFRDTRLKSAIEMVNNIMYGEQDSNSLESLILNIALKAYSNEKNIKLTFVTNIDANTDEASFKRARSGRKAIIRMRNEGESDNSYSSYLVYTSHDKKVIQNMIDKANFSDINVKVENVENILEQLKAYRKSTRVARERTTPSKNLSTFIWKYVPGEDHERIVPSELSTEIDDSKTNVIIISKERRLKTSELRMIKAWYCNENNVPQEDVEIYVSKGQHRIADLEVLKELGELYEDPHSRYAGHSNLYSELLNNRVAKMHTINKNDKNLEKKAFVRLLSAINRDMPSLAIAKPISTIESAYQIAELADFEMPEFNKDLLESIGELGDEEFGQAYSSWEWGLTDPEMEHLIENIGEDKYGLIEDLAAINLSYEKISIDKDGKYERYHSDPTTYTAPKTGEIDRAYKEENKNSSSSKFIQARTEAYLEFIKDIVINLSNIEFNS